MRFNVRLDLQLDSISKFQQPHLNLTAQWPVSNWECWHVIKVHILHRQTQR